MDFDIDLNEIVDEVLNLNKKLTLENILLQKSLYKAALEVEHIQHDLDGAHKEIEIMRAWQEVDPTGGVVDLPMPVATADST